MKIRVDLRFLLFARERSAVRSFPVNIMYVLQADEIRVSDKNRRDACFSVVFLNAFLLSLVL